MQTQQATLREIPLASLTLSTTGAQGERRRRFDKAALAELVESIKTAGVIQPILVRPKYTVTVSERDGGRWYAAIVNIAGNLNLQGPGHDSREAAELHADELRAKHGFEIIAGERRVLAARMAGLQLIPANIRELSDQQVLELQLIENLQREGLHELIEAEGYEALMKSHGYTVEDLVAKVGKSRAYVYARLKLTAMCPEARKAFYAGELSASTALLVARIPLPSLQKQALKEITKDRYDGPMSARSAADHIQRNFMLSLAHAPFPTGEDNLVPGAVACGRCPKNTASQPELFGDVKGASAGVCTDTGCFNAKRTAAAARTAEQARANGQKVLEGDAAKKVAPHGTHNLQGGYVRLDDQCWEDPKRRTFKQLLGKAFKPALLRSPGDSYSGRQEDQEFIEVAHRDDIAPVLKAAGVKPPAARSTSNSEHSAREKRAKEERAYRRELFARLMDKAAPKLGLGQLRSIAFGYAQDMHSDSCRLVAEALGYEASGKEKYPRWGEIIAAKAAEFNEAEVSRLLQALFLGSDLAVSTCSTEKPERMLAAARGLGIDPGAVRRDLAAARQTKAKPTTKAKASRKRK